MSDTDLLSHERPRIAFFYNAWKLHAMAVVGILALGALSYHSHITGEPGLALFGSYLAVLVLGIYAGMIMTSMILIKEQLAADNPGDLW